MAASAITALANFTVSTAQSSVTFSSIPSGYRDLRVVITGSVSADNVIAIVLNGDTTTTNYFYVNAYAQSGSTGSQTNNSYYFGVFGTNGPNMATLELFDYSATDKHKTALSRFYRHNASATYNDTSGMYVLRWANTAAVTSLRLDATTSTFAVGSTFTLYGISA